MDLKEIAKEIREIIENKQKELKRSKLEYSTDLLARTRLTVCATGRF